ncbi:chitobiase/beta-hexosaminidase C-terminal domain-containing protein [Leucobacter chromiireducens]|uniref:chitobiase/beta-hexosaminidase C-terminal domain-containing protein n=1 Tax=Leucobacter chromiireducens TaxID=283877 RepID=UPI003F7D34D4
MSKRRIAALALSGVALLGAQAALPTAVAAHAAVSGEVSPPAASHESGRYVGPQAVTLTSAEGTEVRYTLDGTHPTRDSALATGPILIEKTANLTAVAFTDRAESLPMIRGILVKTAEEPLAQFAVMSDIHLSTGTGPAMAKWGGYFDTLKRIAPNPDALISNGDQINDNYFNSAADHQYPREMLERNLARTGMTDTQVMMSFGNHDDYVTRMAEQYPDDWFPGTTGYYESKIGEFPAFVVNTEAWNTTQANWLYGRLDALSKDPATQGQPIFVFGHRPIPATVWDGAQASNGGLKTNLSAFPQVVYFSGHSHLNITDERSIHQQDFTSVNEGSMSYGENDGKFQVFGPGLARDATIPTAQSVVVDVYGDRIEIDRINYAADPGRTYTDDGAWAFQENPPFASSGSLAGPSWVIARGATPAETKAQFTYTQANRNAVAPAWGERQPTVRQTETGPVLRLPQAGDDQFTAEYTLTVTDVQTGQVTDLVPANGRIYSDYVVAPKPAALDIPLAVRAGNKVGQPIDRTLTIGREYEATLVAYDSYQNQSAPRTFRFVAGALDEAALTDARTRAEAAIAQVERVLGVVTPAQAGDFDLVIPETHEAEAAVAELRAQLASQPATQDAVDALVWQISDGAGALEDRMVSVDRAPLDAAIEEAEGALAEARAAQRRAEAAERVLRAELAEATELRGTLNVTQAQLDAAAGELRAALAVWQQAVESEQPGTGEPGGPGVDGSGSGNTGAGSGTGGDTRPSAGDTPVNDELAQTGSAGIPVLAAAGALVLAGAAALGLRRRMSRG